jgi:hypothetical protein
MVVAAEAKTVFWMANALPRLRRCHTEVALRSAERSATR